jgi:MFS family permease
LHTAEMLTAYLSTWRLFSRDARLYLMAAALFGFTVFGGAYAVLLNLYLLRLGYGPDFIGLVNGTGQLAFALFCLPAGMLGGRYGNRRMLIASLSGVTFGFGLLPLAGFFPGGQTVWLLATNILAQMGIASYFVNSMPFLMNVTGPGERNHVYAAMAALWPLAGFAGSLIGGLLPGLLAVPLQVSLTQPAPYRTSLLIAALLLAPAIWILSHTQETGDNRKQNPAGDRVPIPLALITVLSLTILFRVAGEGAARLFLNVYLDDALQVSTAHIGVIAAAGQLLAVPAALGVPILTARWGKGHIYMLGTLGMAASLTPLALIPHWGAAGLGYMSLIALASITRPAIAVYQMEIVSPNLRTAMAAATTMALGLSWGLIALGGGYMITNLGYQSFFLVAAGLSATGALLFWAYFRIPRAEPVPTAPFDQGR